MKNRYEAVITLTVSYKAAEGDERRQLGYIEDALVTRPSWSAVQPDD